MDYSSDPVLQREMFRPRSKAVKEDGIASVGTPESDMARRKREAAALLEEAKSAQDPSNFTTLDTQDKPAVFRPIAAQSAQAPQANVMQQLQQMQAAGLRPVGMAKGGFVAHMAGGGLTPTIRPAGSAGDLSMEYDNPSNMLTWTDSYMRKVAEEEANKNMLGGDLPEEFRKSSWAETDPEEILKALRYRKAELRMQNPNAPVVDEDTSAPKEKKDRADFQDLTSDLDYNRRIREQTEAGIASLPDKRDYAADREYTKNVSADALAREQAMPDKRDFAGERKYYDELKAENAVPPTSRGVPGAAAEAARRVSGVPGAGIQAGVDTGEEKVVPTKGPDSVVPKEAPDSQPTTLESIKAERAKEREDNLSMAIIQAGLAMAAGKSPNALTNIAEGGMSGIKAFTEAEAASRRAMREDERYARQEKLSRDEMAQREKLSNAQIEAAAKAAEEERKTRLYMFGKTEDRLTKGMQQEFDKTEAAQKIAREDLELRKMVANNQISASEADRLQKENQFKLSLEQDKWKVEQQLGAKSDNMKLFETLGGGDIDKGMKKFQDASVKDSQVSAYKAILADPLSPEEDKAAARQALLKLFAVNNGGQSSGSVVDFGSLK